MVILNFKIVIFWLSYDLASKPDMVQDRDIYVRVSRFSRHSWFYYFSRLAA